MRSINEPKRRMKTFFDRYHHFLLTALCISFLAVMLALTGCSTGNDPDVPSVDSGVVGPVELFIENENKTAPSGPDEYLFEIRKHEPVMAPDGHQITLREFRASTGEITVECVEGGTEVTLELSGLIPNGVYTAWSVVFEAPGFEPTFSTMIGLGSLGPNDGTENSFLASVNGKGRVSTVIPAGPLSMLGHIAGCSLTDEFEWHVVGAYHIDSRTYGPDLGPDGTVVEQFAFIHKQEN